MTEKLAAEIVKKSGIMRDTGMTSATPKPRAGEHTSETDAEARRFADGDYVADYVSASFARRLEAERDLLREREKELVATLLDIARDCEAIAEDERDAGYKGTFASIASQARGVLAKARP